MGERFSAERVIDWRDSPDELETVADDSVAIVFDCTTGVDVDDGDWFTLVGITL
jgi:hypothetical protein